ncbi:MAG TPA: pyrroloquinoline quinone biosynthesis peptide chaperone PqqD [Gemmatimonadaceae bacterium]|jgi:pyrroloquinoline quinone biosynthesis protein D|nr:pyrroloquinoline quinone biosynthesis peptide chaperone PqqD [Gemmatimonadaceae bacterium]
MTVTSDMRPVLWRLARVEFDPVREKPVLLYPEGAMLLNETAAEILSLCDGARTVDDIARTLSEKYAADVSADVRDYLARLADRELVRNAADAAPSPGEAGGIGDR